MVKKKPAPEPDIKIEKYKESLRVQLTREEIEDRAERAAQILQDRDSKEEEMKTAQKHAKAVIEQLEAEVRLDTNEVLTSRKLTEAEAQRELPFGEADKEG